MIFSNTLLNSKFSNIYLKLEKDKSLSVYSKDKNIDKKMDEKIDKRISVYVVLWIRERK